jgi:2-polyprenyl-3-methyl-5-hydroxy-6-metoxy-1,4-benzoquinol methylase
MRHLAFGESKRSWLDRIIAYVRIRAIKREIKKGAKLLDLGCLGYNGELLQELSGQISGGTGIDLSVNPKTKLIKGRVDQKLPIASNTFDAISALAIIEHVDYPEIMLQESYRVLKPGGIVLITTPSLLGKLPLEIMAALGLISKTEIDDHKRYYTRSTLRQALMKAGYKQVKVKYFGILWLNLLAKATK